MAWRLVRVKIGLSDTCWYGKLFYMAKRKIPEDTSELPLIACVFGDMHDPYANSVIFEHLFLPFLKILRPNILIESGDSFDFYQISRFMHRNKRRGLMGEERDLFVERRKQLAKGLPRKCERIILRGNHEERMYRYLNTIAMEFDDADHYWANYLRLDKLGWKVMDDGSLDDPKPSYIMLGDLFVTHGEITRKHAGVAAKEMLNVYGENILMNHTHRLGSSSDRFFSGRQLIAWENMCMCDIDKVSRGYIRTVAKWMNGWSVVYFNEKTGHFHRDEFPVYERKGAYHVMGPNRKGLLSISKAAPVELKYV